ncbi:MAG: hypothetical protein ACTSSG_11560 [Candidatus Heimdallarchaeaceae archaeon]
MTRRAFEVPNWEFVGGLSKKQREELRDHWIEWWEEKKNQFL